MSIRDLLERIDLSSPLCTLPTFFHMLVLMNISNKISKEVAAAGFQLLSIFMVNRDSKWDVFEVAYTGGILSKDNFYKSCL